jgi:hypothetical protein
MDLNFAPQGWECPKCNRVYSPTTIMCLYCPQKTTTSTTTNLTTVPHGVDIGVGGTGVPNMQNSASGTNVCSNYTPNFNSTSDLCHVCLRPKSEHIIINIRNI